MPTTPVAGKKLSLDCVWSKNSRPGCNRAENRREQSLAYGQGRGVSLEYALVKLRTGLHAPAMKPLYLLLLCLAGWLNRNQQQAMQYLQEEVTAGKLLLGLQVLVNALDG